MWNWLKDWPYQVFIGLDQLINTVLGGSADETMSSRCYRLNHIPTYHYLELFVNVLFYPLQGAEHCKHAYEKEILGRQLPYKFYDRAVALNLEMNREKLGDKIEMPK